MVKYITSKHQIAWGIYRVVMLLEILPAPEAAIASLNYCAFRVLVVVRHSYS